MVHRQLIATLTLYLAHLVLGRQADTRMYQSGTCRQVSSVGKNTCAYCNWTGIAKCNSTAYWDMCADNPTPNPCKPNEILTIDSRDYLFNHDDTCKRVCPDVYCYSETWNYTTTCCSCPNGYVPSLTPPTCAGRRGSGVGLTCVGCSQPGEVLSGNDQVGWQCLPKAQTATSKKTTSSSTTKASSTSTHPATATADICAKSAFDTCPKAVQIPLAGKPGRYRCECEKDKTAKTGCPSKCTAKPKASCTSLPPRPARCYPSQKGIDALKVRENFCSTYYNQCDNHKTIGWGHTCDQNGGCDGLRLPIDDCAGEKLLRNDISRFLTYLRKVPNANKLSQGQLDALASTFHQCGQAAIVEGAIYADLKAGNMTKVCDDILKAGRTACHTGVNLERRKAEQQQCKSGSSTPLGCSF